MFEQIKQHTNPQKSSVYIRYREIFITVLSKSNIEVKNINFQGRKTQISAKRIKQIQLYRTIKKDLYNM